MTCCGIITNFCYFVVSVQLVCGVFRWLYENVLGPRFGKSINFKNYGKWARKLKLFSLSNLTFRLSTNVSYENMK